MGVSVAEIIRALQQAARENNVIVVTSVQALGRSTGSPTTGRDSVCILDYADLVKYDAGMIVGLLQQARGKSKIRLTRI